MDDRNAPVTKGDLDLVKQELTAKIDANGEKIAANAAKIDDVEKRLTAKIDANARKIDANAAKIDANHAALTRISSQVVDNKEKIELLITKVDKFDGYFHEIMADLDGLARRFSRTEQEQTAMNSRLDRVEADVATNKRDIKKIKTKLGMP